MSPPRHHRRHHPRHPRRHRRGEQTWRRLTGAVVAGLAAVLLLTGALAQPAHLAGAHGGDAHTHHGQHEHHDDHDQPTPSPGPGPEHDCLLCHLILTTHGPINPPITIAADAPGVPTALAAPASAISLTPLRRARGRAPPATA